MNLAIVGSRDFAHPGVIRAAIAKWMVLAPEGVTIVSGGARGADSIGAEIAAELHLPTIIHWPAWRTPNGVYNPRAGFERNHLIVRDADVVLAFFAPGPASKGTSNTVQLARDAGKTVHVFHEGKWS